MARNRNRRQPRRRRSRSSGGGSMMKKTIISLPVVGRITFGTVIFLGVGYWAIKKWNIDVPFINPKKKT